MPGTRRGIYIEFIGDEIKYVRSAENVLSTNTKLDTSFKRVGVNAKLSAEAQVSAAVKAQGALRAQAINLRAIASASSGEKRIAATQLAERAEAQLAASYGVTTRASKALSEETRKGERDLNKIARGALAGSGLFAAFGRALAFASTGFIAFAAGATVIRKSFDAATQLLATQRAVNQQLKTQGASWAQYGKAITDTDLKLSHVSGFTNQELLQSFEYLDRSTGKVGVALKLQAVAADVARGRNIALSAAALALGKAYGGSITALRRLGIVVPKTLKGMDALNYVAKKFEGQAAANATVAEKFNATLIDSEEIIGTALLPTINKYLTELGNWLAKMNESGRLQRDIAAAVGDFTTVLHDAESVIKRVDDVTGSFKNTLKLLAAFRLAALITGWITKVGELAVSWGYVAAEANAAATAESRALGGGFGGAGGGGRGGGPGPGPAPGGGGAGFLPFLLGGAAAGRIFVRPGLSKGGKRVDDYLKAGEQNAGEVDKAASAAEKSAGTWEKVGADVTRFGKVGLRIGALAETAAMLFGSQPDIVGRSYVGKDGYRYTQIGSGPPQRGPFIGIPGTGVLTPEERSFPRTGQVLPKSFQTPLTGGPILAPLTQPAGTTNPFANLKPLAVWQKFQISLGEEIAQAQAQLTRSTADDVAAAKQIIARIKRLIAAGHLQGQSLAQALQVEASALSTIWSAEDAAATARAQAAQKAQAAIEASIDPIKLEAQLSRDTALGRPTIADLRALRAAAKKALTTEHLTLAQQKEAWDAIASYNQQIKDAIQSGQKQYIEPIKLQIALAREQAFGLDQTKTLQQLKAAALRALKTGKYHGQALIALYNEIANLNQQLSSSAQSALGLFKQANLKRLTRGLGLTRAQREALEGRLSQLGPKGTVPGSGVGAAGYAINPNTDRPIVIHHTTNLDGRVVARNTTVHQQRTRRRNPKQRRGPNAGAAAA